MGIGELTNKLKSNTISDFFTVDNPTWTKWRNIIDGNWTCVNFGMNRHAPKEKDANKTAHYDLGDLNLGRQVRLWRNIAICENERDYVMTKWKLFLLSLPCMSVWQTSLGAELKTSLFNSFFLFSLHKLANWRKSGMWHRFNRRSCVPLCPQ